jgi:dTDP-L-rhamnose 4-epimerase
MAKQILITGGAGFLGGHLSDRLVKLGHSVRILDNFGLAADDCRVPKYSNPDVALFRGDLRDDKCLAAALSNVEIVFHLAKLKGSARSMKEFLPFFENNVIGTSNVLKNLIFNSNHAEKFVLVSSTSCYGEGAYLCGNCGVVYPAPRQESTMLEGVWEQCCPHCRLPVEPLATPEHKPSNPASFYSLTLKQMEEVTLLTGQNYGIPTVVLRLSKVFGPRQTLHPEAGHVISVILNRLLTGRPPVVHEDGLQTRDFLPVQDAVCAMETVMTSEQSNYQVFNIGSGTGRTVLDIVKDAASLLKVEAGFDMHGRFRTWSARHLYSDITKAMLMLKIRPKADFEKSLAETIDWHLSNFRPEEHIRASLESGDMAVQ